MHECNEAPLSNGMRVMEQNFFFTSFRSLKVLRIARNVIVVDIVVLVCRYNSWNFGFGSGTNPYDYDYH